MTTGSQRRERDDRCPDAQGAVDEVTDRREGLEYGEFVEAQAKPRKPVILVGAAASWPAAQNRDPGFFVDRVGHRRVELDGETYAVAQLIELIDPSMREKPAPSLRARKLVEVLPELAADPRGPNRLHPRAEC